MLVELSTGMSSHFPNSFPFCFKAATLTCKPFKRCTYHCDRMHLSLFPQSAVQKWSRCNFLRAYFAAVWFLSQRSRRFLLNQPTSRYSKKGLGNDLASTMSTLIRYLHYLHRKSANVNLLWSVLQWNAYKNPQHLCHTDDAMIDTGLSLIYQHEIGQIIWDNIWSNFKQLNSAVLNVQETLIKCQETQLLTPNWCSNGCQFDRECCVQGECQWWTQFRHYFSTHERCSKQLHHHETRANHELCFLQWIRRQSD